MPRSSVYFYFLLFYFVCEEFSLSYLSLWRDEERLRNSSMSQLHFKLASVSLRQVIALMRAGGGRPKFTPCQYLSNYNCKLCVVCKQSLFLATWRFDKIRIRDPISNHLNGVYNFEFWKSSYYLSKNDLIKCWHHMQLQLIKVKCGVKRENQLNVTFNVFK